MKSEVRVGLISTLIIVCVAGVGACDAGEMMADAMVDAGDMLSDAGELVRDGASDDASAQVPGTVISMDLSCDVVREEVRRIDVDASARDTEQRFRHFYAELRDDLITPASVRAITAVGCDLERFGDAPRQCEEGTDASGVVTTCAGDPPFDPLACRAMQPELADGLVRVHCGSSFSDRLELDPTGSGTFGAWPDEPESGQTVRSVRVTVVVE